MALGLDSVLLVPFGETPQKRMDADPGVEVRLEMARLAAADAGGVLEASDIEARRQGPSFTYRTLEILSEQRPDDELWFLLGADAATRLETWRKPKRIVKLARLGLAARPGAELGKALGAIERLGGRERVALIEMPQIGVSSTEVRERVAAGRPLDGLVPDAVAALIEEQGLYRG